MTKAKTAGTAKRAKAEASAAMDTCMATNAAATLASLGVVMPIGTRPFALVVTRDMAVATTTHGLGL